jgi:hypothetical protein
MDLEVIRQVFPQEDRVSSSPAARKVVDALGTNVGYLMAQMQTNTYIQIPSGIAFQVRNPKLKANYCRITVTGPNSYTMWLARIEVTEKSMRVKSFGKSRNLSPDKLREVFEEKMFPLRTNPVKLIEEVLAKQA